MQNLILDQVNFVCSLYLETCRTPVHKLYGSLCLDGSYGCIHIFWHNISSVEKAHSHIFSVSWVTFYHLVGGFETGIGDLGYCQLFMVRFFGRNDRSVSCQRKMNPIQERKLSRNKSYVLQHVVIFYMHAFVDTNKFNSFKDS